MNTTWRRGDDHDNACFAVRVQHIPSPRQNGEKVPAAGAGSALQFACILEDFRGLLGGVVKRLLGRLVAEDGGLEFRIYGVGDFNPGRRLRNREGVLGRFLEGAQDFLLVGIAFGLADVPFPDRGAGRQRAGGCLELLAVLVGAPWAFLH